MEFEELNINKLEVKDGDFVVVKMDKNIDCCRLQETYNKIGKIFNKNKVIVLSNNMEISTSRKEELIKYIENM